MAKIIGGIGASHSPTIAFAKDTDKGGDPAWAPIFAGFGQVRGWLAEKQADVLLMIYNDHVTSFFFDHYSAFALGVDSQYRTADEGGGPREYPPVAGHDALARHIGASLMADEFDLSFFQNKPLDHGCFSPLSMMLPEDEGGSLSIVPLQVGVLQLPIPSAKRCFKLGQALRKAIESYPEDLRVAIVATGGLSHQVHGERCGFNNEAWDEQFLDWLVEQPARLAEMTIAEYAERGGFEGAEVIMWLIMRGALSDKLVLRHRAAYLPSMTNIATLILEDLAPGASAAENEKQREHINAQWRGVEKLPGTHPFSCATSRRAYRLNDFLHRLIEAGHRQRFLHDFDSLCEEFSLTEEEKQMLAQRRWIELIHYGVIFFLLEKLAAVVGVSNPQIYASMRGESLEEFQKTRRVALQYSVAGGDQAKIIDAS